ncbi:MAG: glycosyltransferase family 2 protein [Rhodobiaceae bacterium]|nr:glycosyltransferase family 2 protein [Rhodobiaceae bacterium]
MTPTFTIIVPTYDHGPTLRYAIDSILAQTRPDFSLVVIGDGAPPSTEDIVAEYRARDERVSYRSFPKGPRTGEEHRHVVLQSVDTPLIAYCSDDDIWFPDHLSEIAQLLREHDFVSAKILNVARSRRDQEKALIDAGRLLPEDVPARRQAHYRLHTNRYRFEEPEGRALCFGEPPRNIAGLTTVAHTLAAYRSLPEGWSPAPVGIFTDLYMWRKFLSDPSCRVRTGDRITSLHLPRALRRNLSADQCLRELALWFELIKAPETMARIRQVTFETPFAAAEAFPQTRPFW